jgi:hypothetical protein
MADHDPTQTDDGNIGGPSADIHYHIPSWRSYWKTCSDRGGHWFFNGHRLPGSGTFCREQNRTSFDVRDSTRDASEDNGFKQPSSPTSLVQDVLVHLEGGGVIGNDPVL